MLNLIKMDFYRLFRTKAVRVGAIAAVLFAFFTSLLNLGIVKIIEYAMVDDPNAADGMSEFFSVVGWMNGVDFAQVVLTGTGMLSLFLSCMIAASYIGGEQSCGFAKNVAGQLPNRGLMVVSKFIATCFIHLMVLIIYTIVCSICAFPFFGESVFPFSITGTLTLPDAMTGQVDVLGEKVNTDPTLVISADGGVSAPDAGCVWSVTGVNSKRVTFGFEDDGLTFAYKTLPFAIILR
jgi:hypothetical protein